MTRKVEDAPKLEGPEPDDPTWLAWSDKLASNKHMASGEPPGRRRRRRGDGRGETDRARGLMLGLALGNVLGGPYEGRRRAAPGEVWRNASRIMGQSRYTYLCDDDDLAQALLVTESACRDGPEMSTLGQRMWQWAECNSVGMGGQTRRVLERWAGMRPQRLAGEQGTAREPNGAMALIEAARREARVDEGQRPRQGNGALMRCAPLAVVFRSSPAALCRAAIMQSVITHWDPVCVWSCVYYVMRCREALDSHEGRWKKPGETLDAARKWMTRLKSWLTEKELWDSHGEVPSLVEETIRNCSGEGESRFRGARAAEEINRHSPWGWTITALHVAIEQEYNATVRAMRQYPWPAPRTLDETIAGGGDADTQGAITGALLGARFGEQGWPEEWRNALRTRRERTSAWVMARGGEPIRTIEEWADLATKRTRRPWRRGETSAADETEAWLEAQEIRHMRPAGGMPCAIMLTEGHHGHAGLAIG